jgi:hypothetical protein
MLTSLPFKTTVVPGGADVAPRPGRADWRMRQRRTLTRIKRAPPRWADHRAFRIIRSLR